MATKKKTTKKATAKVTKKIESKSKMDQAVLIMEKMWNEYVDGTVQRKDIIERFINDVGLTKAGAATYFQTIKKRFIEDESN